MSARTKREIHGRTLELSSLDKVFFPGEGITKGDVIEYYDRVAEVMLPYVRDRFLSMQRWPDGIDGTSFFQKETPAWFPGWIRTLEVEKEGGVNCQVAIEEPATLAYLAQQGSLTCHVWLSRVDARRKPDRMIFDFDPSQPWERAFDAVRRAVRRLRDVLEALGLTPFVMTSGSRGLHVHVPLRPEAGFDVVKPFARDVAELLAARHPDRLTTAVRKDKRGDRIFVDYLRNEYAQTAVAPYSLRARPGAPVATPLDWDELGASGMGPRRYHVGNLFRRLAAKEDPWRGMDDRAAGIGEARKKLDVLLEEEGLQGDQGPP